MVYLEYHKQTEQVVEIHTDEPVVSNDYDYAISDLFEVGDEFEKTIWINEVDENKNLVSYSAIRNNPNANRLLRENVELKQKQAKADEVLTESNLAFQSLLELLIDMEVF